MRLTKGTSYYLLTLAAFSFFLTQELSYGQKITAPVQEDNLPNILLIFTWSGLS